MKFSSTNSNIKDISNKACFVFAYKDKNSASVTTIDEANDAILSNLIKSKVISTDLGEITPVASVANINFSVVYVVGAGDSQKLNENTLVTLVNSISSVIKKKELASLHIAIDDLTIEGRTTHWITQKMTERLIFGFYKYDTTTSKKNPKPFLEELTFISEEAGLQLAIDTGSSIGHGVNVARELGNLPGNLCTPTYLAEQAIALDKAFVEISTTIIDEAELEKMGMGCFMSVARGSTQPGKFIIVEYKGDDAKAKPHVLVGKGITFDTGGISLKPGAGMDEMKYDMGGAASVMGTMTTIAELKPSLNVIGVIAAAENMPAGNATKPGDVVTSLSGKTVEISNTDAEGRLVLCDALTYVERFDPETVIDIATLTGAIVIGLGHHPTAVYANDDVLQNQILNAGKEIWDRGWPMPLWEDYREDLESPYADLCNISKTKGGGSITAATFLSHFSEKYNWAHLDIAGTAWKGKETGATGRPVGMLTQYLLDRS